MGRKVRREIKAKDTKRTIKIEAWRTDHDVHVVSVLLLMVIMYRLEIRLKIRMLSISCIF